MVELSDGACTVSACAISACTFYASSHILLLQYHLHIYLSINSVSKKVHRLHISGIFRK